MRASEVALEQAGALRSRIGLVSMVNVFSGAGAAPAARIARQLGLSPVRTEVTSIGGNTPQWLVNRAAAWIAAGKAETVLITGAEAQRSIRRLNTQRSSGSAGLPLPGREQSNWDDDGGELAPDPIVGDDRPGAGPAELNAGLVAPVHVYALFESVIAHRTGRSFAEHRSALGELMAPFTEVASKHPFAWFPQARAPAELSEISTDNRLVSEPYPKRMCAMLGVDQGAAVVVTSLETARAAGVADGAVFCWSGAEACDIWFPAARPDPGSSPGIRAAASAALEASRITVDDVDGDGPLLVLPLRGADGGRRPRNQPRTTTAVSPSPGGSPTSAARETTTHPRHRHTGRPPAENGTASASVARSRLVRDQARPRHLRRSHHRPDGFHGGHRRRPGAPSTPPPSRWRVAEVARHARRGAPWSAPPWSAPPWLAGATGRRPAPRSSPGSPTAATWRWPPAEAAAVARRWAAPNLPGLGVGSWSSRPASRATPSELETER